MTSTWSSKATILKVSSFDSAPRQARNAFFACSIVGPLIEPDRSTTNCTFGPSIVYATGLAGSGHSDWDTSGTS